MNKNITRYNLSYLIPFIFIFLNILIFSIRSLIKVINTKSIRFLTGKSE